MKKWKLALASLLLPTMALAQEREAQEQQQQKEQERAQVQQPPAQMQQPAPLQALPEQQLAPYAPIAGAQLGFGAAGFGIPWGLGSTGLDAAQRGIVQGVVSSIDYARGMVTIRSGRQLFTVRAKPQQIALYKPGELTTVHYAQYLGVPWMIENRAAGMYSPLNFAQLATVVGVVTGVDKSTGVVTLAHGEQAASFQGHPLDVEALLPGQFVALSYSRIAGANWINNIAPATEGTIGQQPQ
ncbi:MAG: hypothetical protein HYZ28_18790 [Myxococcales bacterium]|nr:hypothetical protein [Myxococcales bacterium]